MMSCKRSIKVPLGLISKLAVITLASLCSNLLALNWHPKESNDNALKKVWMLEKASLSELILQTNHLSQNTSSHISIKLPLQHAQLDNLKIRPTPVSLHQNNNEIPIYTFTLVPKHIHDNELGDIHVQSGKITVFSGRLKASVTINGKAFYIEPKLEISEVSLHKNSQAYEEYIVTNREDANTLKKINDLKSALLSGKHSSHEKFNCKTHDTEHEISTQNQFMSHLLSLKSTPAIVDETQVDTEISNQTQLSKKTFGQSLHVYRLALAATSAYNLRVGYGDTSLTYAEMVHAVNRVNEIFERDFAIRLQLVSGKELIATQSSAYSEGNVVSMLSQNQSRIDSIFGSNNYDIGHVLGIQGGGIASLASACSSRKAQGVSASSAPTSTIFYVDYFAHELAHQLAATHTFNADGNQSGICQGNRVAKGSSIFDSSAYEVGSGSTIMSYAGLCSQQNIQYSADDYFHAKSIEQVRNFSEGDYSSYNGSCGSYINTYNNPPAADAGNDYTIPAGTPFDLTASAYDNDDNDAQIHYTWEQYDLGPYSTSRNNMHSDTGLGPLIRSVEGSTNPVRSIPKYKDTLLGNFNRTNGIRLPTQDRDLNFKLTVRSGSYGVDQDSMTVTTHRRSHPFALVQPNDSITLSANETTAVSWITADSDQAPVNCSSVEISLSDDGGQTFPYILASNANNDGFEEVTLPNINTSSARVKIQCRNNIFYSVSDSDFAIKPTSKPLVTMTTSKKHLNEGSLSDAPDSVSYTVTLSEPHTSNVSFNYYVQNAGKEFTSDGVIDSQMIDANDFSNAAQIPQGIITIPKGELSTSFSLNISPDNAREWDEYFQVVLSENNLVSMSIHHAMNVIISDDEPAVYDDLVFAEDEKPVTLYRKSESGHFGFVGIFLSLFVLLRRKINKGISY